MRCWRFRSQRKDVKMKWMTSRLPLKDGVKRPVSSNFITLCGYKSCRFTNFTGEALGSAGSINFVTHLWQAEKILHQVKWSKCSLEPCGTDRNAMCPLMSSHQKVQCPKANVSPTVEKIHHKMGIGCNISMTFLKPASEDCFQSLKPMIGLEVFLSKGFFRVVTGHPSIS